MSVEKANPLVSFMDSFPVGIVLLDVYLNIVYANNKAQKLLSIAGEPAKYAKITRIVPTFPANFDTANPAFYSSSSTVDGRKLWFSLLSASHGANSRTICFVSGKQPDLKMEEHLAVERELNDILSYSFDGIGVVDGNFILRKMNPAYEKIAGIPPDHFIKRPIIDIVNEGYFDRLAAFEAAKTKQSVFVIQHYPKTKNVALVTCNPVYDENNRFIRIITNVRDITNLYQVQEQLKNFPEHLAGQNAVEQKVRAGSEEFESDFVYSSDTMEKLMQLVHQIARVDSSVIIYGESGVGKGLLAKILYNLSNRRSGPFIKVNCGAIPEHLVESELFGYEPGAFTGARREGKQGLIQAADKGILFLDEIGELPYALQPKLLEFLQDREFTRVGGTRPTKVNVRVIAATNQDLLQMVKENKFRKDLYYRLNVVPINIPALREHKQDIPLLLQYYTQVVNAKFKLHKYLSDAVIKRLINYDWPGNVRELEYLLESLFVSSPENEITLDDLFRLLDPSIFHTASPDTEHPAPDRELSYDEAMELYEKRFLTDSIRKYGSLKKAADVLQIHPSTIWRKLKGYESKKPD